MAWGPFDEPIGAECESCERLTAAAELDAYNGICGACNDEMQAEVDDEQAHLEGLPAGSTW